MTGTKSDGKTRREFLGAAAGLLGAGVLSCSRSRAALATLSCTDVSGLSEADRAAREAVGYVDRVSDASKHCDSCHQYIASAGACGACKLIRGPVHPLGSCRIFAARA